jgi:GNAT superfamily N-acetyltransferase
MIRAAYPGEEALIASLVKRIAIETYTECNPENVAAWADMLHHPVKHLLRINSDNALQLVVDSDGIHGAAYALAHKMAPSDEDGFLGGLYLDESVRGQGIGHLLVQQRLEWLKDKGVSRVGTTIAKGNAASEHLLGSYGFVAVHEEPGEMMPEITWVSYQLVF